jgi:hypothetical protein
MSDSATASSSVMVANTRGCHDLTAPAIRNSRKAQKVEPTLMVAPDLDVRIIGRHSQLRNAAVTNLANAIAVTRTESPALGQFELTTDGTRLARA